MRWFNFDIVVAVQDGDEDVASVIQQIANVISEVEYDPDNPAESKRPFELRVRELMPPANVAQTDNSNGAKPEAAEVFLPGDPQDLLE